MSLGRILLLAALTGCAAPTVVDYPHPDGEGIVFEYFNYPLPPGCSAACYLRVGSIHAIYATQETSAAGLRHERGHMLGMRHTAWDSRYCARVTKAGGDYSVGQALCTYPGGERIR